MVNNTFGIIKNLSEAFPHLEGTEKIDDGFWATQTSVDAALPRPFRDCGHPLLSYLFICNNVVVSCNLSVTIPPKTLRAWDFLAEDKGGNSTCGSPTKHLKLWFSHDRQIQKNNTKTTGCSWTKFLHQIDIAHISYTHPSPIGYNMVQDRSFFWCLFPSTVWWKSPEDSKFHLLWCTGGTTATGTSGWLLEGVTHPSILHAETHTKRLWAGRRNLNRTRIQ